MPNLFELKDLIRGFVIQNLPEDFKTVYWQSERMKVPKKPYCMLTELSESNSLVTGELQFPNSLTKQVTQYKTAVITIAVYVDGLGDYDDRKAFAYNSLNNLRTVFETMKAHYRFKDKMTVRNLSGIRPLNETVGGGYLFRYEFDMTIGFHEIYEYELPVSHAVNIDLDENDIHIEVSEDDLLTEESGRESA
ncbi:hypothetical protein IAC76_05825 [Spirochaetes bacterium]|uniref:Phage neck terminator protein gp12-like domain-containing protein n=1 Tax=Candidatus Scatousia excrementipullorum TaxID=2840936 RepID=A0A9D9DQF4_9BACT|nr:hypothetical protein [Candidatus Scatousia excrementipullorum]